MPTKEVKKLRDDILPLEQPIKRKATEPGVPKDVGVWSGSSLTGFRNACKSVAGFAFSFLGHLGIDSSSTRMEWFKKALHLGDTSFKSVGVSRLHDLELTDSVSTQII